MCGGLSDHVDAFLIGEQHRFRDIIEDADIHPVEQPQAALHHIDMTMGHRVERPWIDCHSCHRLTFPSTLVSCRMPDGSRRETAPLGWCTGIAGVS